MGVAIEYLDKNRILLKIKKDAYKLVYTPSSKFYLFLSENNNNEFTTNVSLSSNLQIVNSKYNPKKQTRL